jgi:hypothetical protein
VRVDDAYCAVGLARRQQPTVGALDDPGAAAGAGGEWSAEASSAAEIPDEHGAVVAGAVERLPVSRHLQRGDAAGVAGQRLAGCALLNVPHDDLAIVGPGDERAAVGREGGRRHAPSWRPEVSRTAPLRMSRIRTAPLSSPTARVWSSGLSA